jgi:hypothetical protein
MREDGSDLKRISPPLGTLKIPDVYLINQLYATLLWQTPGGDYVFLAATQKGRRFDTTLRPPVDFLVIGNPESNTSKVVSINSSGTRTMGIALSPAGDSLAYATHVVTAHAGSTAEFNPVADIYIQSLTDDPPKKLMSYIPDVSNPAGQTHLWVIGWLEN